MTNREVIKVTSKGQLTLPVEIRRDLSLDQGSYLYVTKLGSLILMRKVEDLTLDEISEILQKLAEDRGITRELLTKEVEKARKQLMEERHVQA